MISEFELFSDLLKGESREHKTALICQEETYTFGELRRAVELCASDLVKLGVKEGDHVAVWGYNSINWVVTMMAVVRLGAVAVLVNYNLASKYIAPLLEFSDVNFLAYGLNRDTKQDSDMGGALAKIIGIGDKTYRFTDMDYKARLSAGEQPVELPEENPDGNRDSVIIFTSGTTAMPKGVLLSQKSVLNNGLGAGTHLQYLDHRQNMGCLALPLFHSYGLTVLFALLQWETPGNLISELKPDVLIDAIGKYHIGILFSIGILNKGMLASPRFSTEVAPYLRWSVLGGEFADAKTILRVHQLYPDIVYLVGFGQTEAGPIISLNTPWDTVENRANTVGTAMGDTQIRIVDPTSRNVLETGKAGEVWVKSDSLMNGYYKLPPEKQAIDADGWLHTGDLGYTDEHDHLWLTGRLKDIIIKNGENISPKEVENALLLCPGVKAACVLGTPSKTSGEQINACLIMAEGCSFDERFIRTQLGKLIPTIKIPERFFIFDAFPMNDNGKIAARTLREKILLDMNENRGE